LLELGIGAGLTFLLLVQRECLLVPVEKGLLFGRAPYVPMFTSPFARRVRAREVGKGAGRGGELRPFEHPPPRAERSKRRKPFPHGLSRIKRGRCFLVMKVFGEEKGVEGLEDISVMAGDEDVMVPQRLPQELPQRPFRGLEGHLGAAEVRTLWLFP